MCDEKKKQGGCCQDSGNLEASNAEKCNPEKTKDCHGEEKQTSCCCKK